MTHAPCTRRLTADARYLQEKLTGLKNVTAPTAMLETIVSEKRVVVQQPPPETVRGLRLLNTQMNQILHEARKSPYDLPRLEDTAIAAMQTVQAELWALLHGSECH